MFQIELLKSKQNYSVADLAKRARLDEDEILAAAKRLKIKTTEHQIYSGRHWKSEYEFFLYADAVKLVDLLNAELRAEFKKSGDILTKNRKKQDDYGDKIFDIYNKELSLLNRIDAEKFQQKKPEGAA